jgi:hypothetical protein
LTSWEVLVEGLGVTVCPERTLAEKGAYISVRCFVEDGGGPSDVGVQAQASNRHELLGSRALVVSVDGKGAALTASGEIRGVERE